MRSGNFNRQRMALASVSLVGVVMTWGCGGGSGGCGNPPELFGNWSGTLKDSNCGSGAVSLVFSQSGCAIDGVWSSDFSVPACNGAGTLHGNADHATLTARLETSQSGTCPLEVTGVVVGPNEVSGNYAAPNCQVSGGGTFDIHRTSGGPTPTPGPTRTPTP